MEILIEIFCSVVGEVVSSCCVCMCCGIKNRVKFRKNLDKLDKEINNLVDLRNNLQQRAVLPSSEKAGRKVKKHKIAVEEWMKKTEKLETEVSSIQAQIVNNQNKKSGRRRCRDSNEVARLLGEVEVLAHKGRKFLKQSNTKDDQHH